MTVRSNNKLLKLFEKYGIHTLRNTEKNMKRKRKEKKFYKKREKRKRIIDTLL